MFVIFLDIDGVLNHQPLKDLPRAEGQPLGWYSPKCVANLNKLTDETNAKIVVSSTWRLGKSVEELQAILASMGVTGEVIDKTPTGLGKGSLRGNEIRVWLNDNQDILGYVIFDDDSDMLLWQKDHFIQTNPYTGLTRADVYKAKRSLYSQGFDEYIFNATRHTVPMPDNIETSEQFLDWVRNLKK